MINIKVDIIYKHNITTAINTILPSNLNAVQVKYITMNS